MIDRGIGETICRQFLSCYDRSTREALLARGLGPLVPTLQDVQNQLTSRALHPVDDEHYIVTQLPAIGKIYTRTNGFLGTLIPTEGHSQTEDNAISPRT